MSRGRNQVKSNSCNAIFPKVQRNLETLVFLEHVTAMKKNSFCKYNVETKLLKVARITCKIGEGKVVTKDEHNHIIKNRKHRKE